MWLNILAGSRRRCTRGESRLLLTVLEFFLLWKLESETGSSQRMHIDCAIPLKWLFKRGLCSAVSASNIALNIQITYRRCLGERLYNQRNTEPTESPEQASCNSEQEKLPTVKKPRADPDSRWPLSACDGGWNSSLRQVCLSPPLPGARWDRCGLV